MNHPYRHVSPVLISACICGYWKRPPVQYKQVRHSVRMNQNRFWSRLAAVLHFCLDMWLEIAAGEILFAWPRHEWRHFHIVESAGIIPTIRSRVIVWTNRMMWRIQIFAIHHTAICMVLRARPPCPCVSKAQDVPLRYHRSNWKPWPITTLALWPCHIKVLQQTFLWSPIAMALLPLSRAWQPVYRLQVVDVIQKGYKVFVDNVDEFVSLPFWPQSVEIRESSGPSVVVGEVKK